MRQDSILQNFVTRVRLEIPAAAKQTTSYLEDHLPAILGEMVQYLRQPGSADHFALSIILADAHGTQRAESPRYTISDLRREHRIFREAIMDQMAPRTLLSRETTRLFAEICELVLSHATEHFVRNSARDLVQHKLDRELATEQIRDAHERQALAENQNRWLERMLDHLPKPLFLLDPKANRVIFSNRSADSFLGFSYKDKDPAEAYGTLTLASDASGRPLDYSESPAARTLRGERLTGDEFILTTPVGRFHVRAFSEQLPASFNQPDTAVLLLQDITALKEVESTLKQTEGLLKQAIEIAQVGFWYIDLQSSQMSLSPLTAQHFGFGYAKHTGPKSDLLNAAHPRDRERISWEVRQTLEEGAPYHTEYRVVHPSGEAHWLEARGEATRDENGRAVSFMGTTLDITERKKLQGQLETAKSFAESASAAKSQFLANMSHEIRTPLGAIMGFVGILKDETLSPPERDSYVSIIERNSLQLSRIVDDILDLSKVEAGMMRIEKIEFSLPELLSDFSALMGLKAREKGIGFFSEATGALPRLVVTDPTRLRQILMNVVGNAIKFTDHGRVDLKIGYHEGALEFEIADTGRGITPEQEKNLFQPFSQGDTSVTRRYGGTGLGLMLSRSLSDALGGEFFLASSTPGSGSVFKVRVKVGARDEVDFVNGLGFASEAARSPPGTGQLADMNVLLVEDSPDNQALLSVFLRRSGARVNIASDGLQGVRMAQEEDYDVVLMDVQMPVMDGITAVRELRKRDYKKPIIAITAHAMKEERARCAEAGFDDFLSKPIARADLVGRVALYRKP